MRKNAIIIALVLFAAYACDRAFSTSELSNDSVSVRSSPNLLPGFSGWFPDSSTIDTSNSAYALVVAPQGWSYIFEEKGTGNYYLSTGTAGIKITCDCTEGTGCNPWIQNTKKGKYGCNMQEGCSKCTKKVEHTLLTSTDTSQWPIWEVEGGGFVNLGLEIDLADPEEDLPLVFPAMFEINTIESAIEEFLEDSGIEEYIYSTDSTYQTNAPANYFHVVLNIYGRAGLVMVHDSILNDPMLSVATITAGKDYKCDCTEGSCPFKTYLSVKYCDSKNCTGECTLTETDEVPNTEDDVSELGYEGFGF